MDQTRYGRRGRMRPFQESAIQSNTALIVREVDAVHVTGHLYSRKAINNDDMQEIRDEPRRERRTERLLSILHGRSPWAFDHFVTALRKAGYHKVVKTLQSAIQTAKLQEIGKERIPDRPSTSEASRAYVKRCQMVLDDFEEVHQSLRENGLDDGRLSKLEGEMTELLGNSISKIQQLQGERASKGRQLRNLEDNLRGAKRRIWDLTKSLRDLDAKNYALTFQMEALKEECASLRDTLKAQKKEIKEIRRQQSDYPERDAGNAPALERTSATSRTDVTDERQQSRLPAVRQRNLRHQKPSRDAPKKKLHLPLITKNRFTSEH